MSTFILTTLFSLAVCIESTAYGIYEMKINKNKPAGILLIMLSIIGVVFPIYMYTQV